MAILEEHVSIHMLCFHVYQARFIVSAEYNLNFIEVLFLTHIVLHTNTIESTWRHVEAFLSQYNRIGGLRLSTSSHYVWGGVPIRH